MSIKKNFFYNATLSVAQLILPIITFPYVTRILLPQGLGDVNFIDNIVQYIIIIAALGIPLYGTREIARVKHSGEKLNKVFTDLFVLHFLVSVVLCIIFLIICYNVEPLASKFTLCVIGTGIILTNCFALNWLFSGLENFAYITKVNLFVRFIGVISIFLFVKTVEDRNVYYGITLTIYVLTGIINTLHARKFVSLKLAKLSIVKHIRPLVWLFSLSILTNAYVLLDSVILGFLKGTIEVGYYTVSTRLSKLPVSLMSSLTVVLIPALSSNFTNNSRNTAIIAKSFSFTILFSIPVSFGIFTLAPELVEVFAGKNFLPSILSLRVLSFVIIPISLALVAYQILLPLDKERFIMSTAVIGLILSLFLNFFLIPRLNNLGSAIASLITEMTVAVILLRYSINYTDIKMPYKTMFHAIIASLMFVPLHWLISHMTGNSISTIVLTVLSSAFLYPLLMIYVFNDNFLRNNTSFIFQKIFDILPKKS